MIPRKYLFGVALLATMGIAGATALQMGGGSSGGSGSVIAPEGSAPETTLAAAQGASAMVTSLVSSITRHDVSVTTVDPTATQQNNSQTGVPNKHLIFVPTNSADRKGRLYLFISGTNSTETREIDITKVGAKYGYHAITVAFPNYDAVAQLCRTSKDNDCTAKVRQEILTGVNASTLVSIAPKDSLETRLKNLLVYLNTTYPTEGWGNYLIGSTIDWSKISAAGHSQGAGHVAYLAKTHAMYRAAIISGVADTTKTGAIAPWLSWPNQTPAANQYGFTHSNDNVVTLSIAQQSWDSIGLNAYGATQLVDGASAPYSGSHKLKTSVSLGFGVNAHIAMVDDNTLPRDSSGTPVWEPVWVHMSLP